MSDTTIAPTFVGRWGRIWQLPEPKDLPRVEGARPETSACLAHWYLESPPAHPVWPHYVFFTCHLRDVPGQTRPPVKETPHDSHNVMLVALNPERGPWSIERVLETLTAGQSVAGAALTPLNVSVFLRGATDAEAIEFTRLAARAMVEGHLPIEPDDFVGGREAWRATVVRTLEHLRHGSHPSITN